MNTLSSLNKIFLKALLPILLISVFVVKTSIYAQNAPEQRLSSYQIISLLIQDEAWEEALIRLESNQSAVGDLLRAKIYYRSSQLQKAWDNLQRIRLYELNESEKIEYYFLKTFNAIHRANFLVAFESIEALGKAKNISDNDRKLVKSIYQDLLKSPASSQRVQLISSLKNASIAADLVRSSIYLSSPITLNNIIDQYADRPDAKAEIINEVSTCLSDSAAYIQKMLQNEVRLNYGDGIDIGLLLPVFDQDSPEFDIIHGLYNGIKLASEKNTGPREVFFELIDTSEQSVFQKELQSTLNSEDLDLIIGPLFSENLSISSTLSNPSQIPFFAPLANTVNLAERFSWIYQLNPGFPNRGMQAAEFMLSNYPEIDSVMIIAEKGSLGERSALAFRDRVQKDSVHISSFLVEDFAAIGYDLRPYSDLFTTDSTLIDSLGIVPFKAVYAPFSGSTTETMINLLLTGLESQSNFPLIIGSGEWQNYELSGFQALRFEIIYDSFQLSGAASNGFEAFLNDYEKRFGKAPNEQALLGYDLGNYLINGLQKYGSIERFIELMPYIEEYKGVSINIDFSKGRYNRSMHYQKLTN